MSDPNLARAFALARFLGAMKELEKEEVQTNKVLLASRRLNNVQLFVSACVALFAVGLLFAQSAFVCWLILFLQGGTFGLGLIRRVTQLEAEQIAADKYATLKRKLKAEIEKLKKKGSDNDQN